MIDLKVFVHGGAHHLLVVLILPETHDLVLMREFVTVGGHVTKLSLGVLVDVGQILLLQLIYNALVVVLLTVFEGQLLI